MLVAGVVAVASCGNPGSETDRDTTPSDVSTTIGPDPVTLTMRVNTDQEALWSALAAGFEEAEPSVTIQLTTEDFATLQQNAPRYLAAENPPDLLRLPAPGDAVKDQLLLNLDEYADAYGWDQWPESQLEQLRVSDDGRHRGQGALYGVGIGFQLTGLYYNIDLARQIGMETPPETIEELVAAMDDAAAAGKTPMMASGNNAFVLQALMHAYGAAEEVSAWVGNAPRASIQTPETVAAASTVREWVEAGYYPEDPLSLDDEQALGNWFEGEALFLYQGGWLAGAMDQNLAGKVGFVLFPPETAGDPRYAMSAPNGLVIPEAAEHPNEAAAFLNWANTSEEGRQIQVDQAGLAPGGSTDLPTPEAAPGSVLSQTLEAFAVASEQDTLIDFLPNATPGMLSATLNPQTQLLVSGQITPAEYIANLQAEYESDLRD
ncbi:extracellular solute-binding protein [Streptomyces sp. DSM 44915]|uniref:Extracellular solute-binding protein n=1 Tax=Streptomyces chisholmiae TaxID=3075540 RepID=A0ABU2JQK5_9ACTN|nr:extracellular solute-binding protein [Streptomyces sp. DSM 44915]MDT0267271.1 extracellular solute-binding protein [Streptomyces sp. DSM 44915]